MVDTQTERTTHVTRQLVRVVQSDLRRVAGQRRTWAAALVQLLPVLGAALLVQFFSADGLNTYTSLVEGIVFPLLLPAVAIVFGGPLLVSEIEGRTLTYLTSRPVGKRTLFAGKWLASAGISLVLTLLPLVGLYVVCLVLTGQLAGSGVVFGRTLLAAGTGTLAYTALFAAISALFATNLVASVVYFTLVELGLGMVASIELLTVRFHLENAAGLGDGDPDALAGLLPETDIALEWWMSDAALAAGCLLAVALGAAIFEHRQYEL